jgi:uncharacterized protein (DUF1800 family)
VAAALERHGTAAELIDAMLAAPPLPFEPPVSIDVPWDQEHPPLYNGDLVMWWDRRMSGDDAGLHDRMMWFWHGTFTTSAEKTTFVFPWRQLRTIHGLALGNFRDLAQAMVVDAAMLQFLDGVESRIEAPNENLARELMELFLLGRGHYTEADVRAGARALSGWSVDATTNRTIFHPERGPQAPDTFLGEHGMFHPKEIVDAILRQDAVGPHIVTKLWKYFIGGPVDDGQVAAWANAFVRDFEIQPLVTEILRSDAFRRARLARTRTGLEWYLAAHRILGLEESDQSVIEQLGQTPYHPPNVAGWPDETGWVSAGSVSARAGYLLRSQWDAPDLGDDHAPRALVEAALRKCGVQELSQQTFDALMALAQATAANSDRQARALVHAVLLSPEFALA